MSADQALTFCLSGFPGAHRALATLARTTGMTRHLSIAHADAGGAEIGFFCAHLREVRPALMIVGGWSPAYEPLVETAAAVGTRTAVYWTSSGGQSGLSREIGKLAAVLEHRGVQHVLVAGGDLARALPATVAAHLPVTLDLRRVRANRPAQRRKANVSLFFPWREAGRKNALNALLAAALLRDRVALRLNGLSEDPEYRDLLAALRLPHRELGWMAEADYRRVLSRIDVGLQPSFAETFDYVAADHLARAVPVVASAMVPVVHGLPASVRRHLLVRNPDSAVEIAAVLERLTGDRRLGRWVGEAAAAALRRSNERNVAAAAKVIAALLHRAPSAGALAPPAARRVSRRRSASPVADAPRSHGQSH